jgi:CRISPR-associated protein Csd1
MILQSLVQLYDRLAADPATSATLPLRGYSKQNIAFSVVIDLTGKLVAIRDEREQAGKKLVARDELMPGGAKSPGSGLNPNLFWDQPTYMLGFCIHSAEEAANDEAKKKKRDRAPREFASFRERQLANEKGVSCPEFSALCRFLESWDADAADRHPGLQFLRTEKITGFGAFRIAVGKWLHDAPAIKSWWDQQQTDGTAKGMCLISGEEASIARLHPSLKTFPNASAKLVSFQDPAYASYGKDQSFNAPVSELAAFKYATALNWLLDGPRPQRLRIGDTTVVFWSEQRTEAESLLGYLLGGQPANESSEDAALNQKLEAFLDVLRQGGGHLAELGNDLNPRSSSSASRPTPPASPSVSGTPARSANCSGT